MELFKYIEINNHTIKFVDNKQFSDDLIYSLGLVKLEALKTYIKNKPVTNLIKLFKFLARASIFFDKKSNKSLRLYVD